MLFSKLRLSGFKSFVDPTELDIMAGLTGVVGPNGCGKSNLLEALRWVMGESRASAMRGGAMEDVIFAGAGARPPRHFAEVSLLIDNTDGTAPAPFTPEPRLEITRRINRDLGSAFKINGREQRARDVQMLFADVSTGARSPSLVRQGEIAELINAKPKARRRILEEAAGIAGLYQRRHEAELKLRGVRANLERLDDILQQLQGQLNLLAKQVRQAKRYRRIGEELRGIEATLLYLRWQQAEDTYVEAARILTQATGQAGASEAAASQTARARDEASETLRPLRAAAGGAAAGLQRLQVEADGLIREETRAHQTIESLSVQLKQLKLDSKREAELDTDAARTIKTLQDEQVALTQGGDAHTAALAEAQERASSASGDLQKAEETQNRLSEDIARLSASHQSATRMFDEASAAVKKYEGEIAASAESRQTLKSALAAGESHLKTLTEARDKAEQAAAESEQNLLTAEATRAECQGRESAARTALSEAESRAHALRSEIATLDHLIGTEENTGAGAKATKPVIDGLEVAAGYESALGAALGDDLKAPKVKTNAKEDSAHAGWNELKAYEKPLPLPENLPSLADYVKGADVLTRRLSQIGVVDKTNGARLQALLNPGQRLVSKDGALWRWDGYTCPAQDASQSATLRLKQINRRKELTADLKKQDKNLDAAKSEFETQKTALETAGQNEESARTSRGATSQKRSEAEREFLVAQSEHHRLSIQMESASATESRLAQDLLQVQKNLTEAEGALGQGEALESLRAEGEAAKQRVQETRAAMLEARSKFDELQRESQRRRARLSAIETEITSWQTRGEDAAKRLSELKNRHEEITEKLAAAELEPAKIKKRKEELFGLTEVAEKKNKESADALATAEQDLRTKESAARKAQDENASLREQLARAEVIAQTAQEQKQTAAQRIEEELDCEPQEVLTKLEIKTDTLPDLPDLENKAQRLRAQREALGAINLRAEEDAGELTEQYETLNTEKTDLERAVEKLRHGINSLNREGRSRLLAAFDEVNKNFSTLFQNLFDGGTAKLTLVESDDPLDAGLEIICQPPGKKLSTLSLLSGGEQTLTALALIFAVFLANPSPICVLDEVDAPLDDANVTRFCDLLDGMVKNTQTRFLIITHHVITMSRMSRLFGVTMAEKGVSQLVSVDLDAAETLVQSAAAS